jgi:hypothetical protein
MLLLLVELLLDAAVLAFELLLVLVLLLVLLLVELLVWAVAASIGKAMIVPTISAAANTPAVTKTLLVLNSMLWVKCKSEI